MRIYTATAGAAILAFSAAAGYAQTPGVNMDFRQSLLASGRIDNQSFGPTGVTFVSTANTANRVPNSQGFSIDHATSFVNLADMGSVAVLTPTRTFVTHPPAPFFHSVAYARAGLNGTPLHGVMSAALIPWNMTTPVGPTGGTGYVMRWSEQPQIETSAGVLILNDAQFIDSSFTALAPPDTAEVLDFERVARNNADFNYVGHEYDEGEYRLTCSGPFGNLGRQEYRYPGSTALASISGNTLITLKRLDGGVFSVTSIDLANLHEAGQGFVYLRGFYPGGGMMQLLASTGQPGGTPMRLTRIHLPNEFCGIERLEWRQEIQQHQFDNIHVSATARLDFEALHQAGAASYVAPNPYVEDGYRFTHLGQYFESYGVADPNFAGSTSLFNPRANTPTTLERADGLPFDIFEVHLANLSGPGSAAVIFTGTRVDGSTVVYHGGTSDPNGLPNTLTYMVFPNEFRLLTKLEWNQTPPGHQFDDLRVGRSNVCYACDFDLSTGFAVCDIFDFLRFQNLFAASDVQACDCDTSSGPGLCDIFDFLCFQNHYDENCGRHQ